ncbi:hypothetical protein [Sphingomonas sp. UYP23]
MIKIQRFNAQRICGRCNNLDSIDPASRPGRWFSLTPVEMGMLRRFAGSDSNRGKTVTEVVGLLRGAARHDYLRRIGPAVLVGRALADEMTAAAAAAAAAAVASATAG